MINNLTIINYPNNYDTGAVLIDLKIYNWNELHSFILRDDLYKPESEQYGCETEPHLSVITGLEEKNSTYPLELLNDIYDYKPKATYKVYGNEIDCFENEEHDVLILKCQCKQAVKLNEYLASKYDYNCQYDFNPHLTIAYLKKGKGKMYKNLFYPMYNGVLESRYFNSDTIAYTSPKGKKYFLRSDAKTLPNMNHSFIKKDGQY